MKSPGRQQQMLVVAAVLVLAVGFVLARRQTSTAAGALPGPTDTPVPALAAIAPSASPTPEGIEARPAVPGIADRAEGDRTSPDPEIVAFNNWLQRYASASNAVARQDLEPEGIELARKRRAALAALIRSDPKHALEVAVSARLRGALPTSIGALLEEHVSRRGQLAVFGVCLEPDAEGHGPHEVRRAILGDRVYEAFVFGRREGEPTRSDIPLWGVAVDQLLALDENPLRVLEAGELEAVRGTLTRTECPVCERLKAEGRTSEVAVEGTRAVEVAGEVQLVCSPTHAAALNDQFILAEAGAGEGGGGLVTMDYGAAGWTLGEKRLLFIRVEFPDLPGTPFPDSTGTNLITDLNRFYLDMSSRLAGFAPPGAGSDLTPTLVMPQNASWYGTNDDFLQLRADARSAAASAGYALTNYDFDLICFGPVPGWESWSGMGAIGAAGAWLRDTFISSVAAHELGHNFGLQHANAWDTGGESVNGPGTSVEYGDPFDVMGGGYKGDDRHQINVRSKDYLSWLSGTNEVLTVRTSGTYRVFAHDAAAATGLRALKIVRKHPNNVVIPLLGYTNYWIELRQAFTGNPWLGSGAGLRFIPDLNRKSLLLDATPGSPDGLSDSPLVIGRTYSDPAVWLHITPVGLGGTTPESLDVVVNIGNFITNNLPPGVELSASTNLAEPGATVQFVAAAADANGDALAYHWDFGDGSLSTNSAAVSHRWIAPGDYVVRCQVTDMKGGTASDSVVVVVGLPSTYRISGRVTEGGEPLPDVRVQVSSRQMAYTDSDGRYVLPGLAAGDYLVQAKLYGYTLESAGFTNTVRVGPDAVGIDFLAFAASPRKPWILIQPQGQAVSPGTDTGFTLLAAGTPPLSYQWWFNGAALPGATASRLERTNAQPADAGDYLVVVTNVAGSVTSRVASLIVPVSPMILRQPQGRLANIGSEATFSVGAIGQPPLRYQWWFNATNAIAAGTNATLTLGPVQDGHAGTYSVVVDNGASAVSVEALLAVNHLPVPAAPILERAAGQSVKTRVTTFLGRDPDGDPLTLLSAGPTSVRGGRLRVTGQWLYYAPPPGETNADSFSFAVSDGRGGVSAGAAIVSIRTEASGLSTLWVEALPDGSVRIRGDGIPGRGYGLDYIEGAGLPVWQRLASVQADEQGAFEYLDVLPPGSPARFYRVVEP